jgi:superfamily II DNA or RNA helicase
MTADRTEFDWERLDADLVRRFAGALSNWEAFSTEEALALLRREVAWPDADLFADRRICTVASDVWLPHDGGALDRVYSGLLGGAVPPPASKKPASAARQLRDVRAAVMPRHGGRPTAAVRDALAQALLESGGAYAPLGALVEFRPFNSVPTHGDPVRLYEYQQRVVTKLRASYRAQGNRMVGVVVMPTGAGKTITAAHWLLDHPVRAGRKVLWITHRVELQVQTAEAFVRCAPTLADARPDFKMRLIGGGYSPVSTIADSGSDVVVATIGSLSRDRRAVRAFLQAHPCVVVFDEAHHCVARTWREVLKLARDETNDAVLGLTATPTRMSEVERQQLGRLLRKTIEQVTMTELVASGHLAKAYCESIPTHVEVERRLATREDFVHLRRFGEISERLAGALARNVARNRVIVDTYLAGPSKGPDSDYGQTLVFATTIDHAHILARDFARRGVIAGALTSKRTSLYLPGPKVAKEDVSRFELLDMFRGGEVPVLVNVAVLTEGVDVPAAKTAFLARPTGSEVLMSQMVGRALRGKKVGGTPHAYLVSFRDHWELFDDWMDPIMLPGVADAEVERPEEPEREPTAPRQPTLRETDWRALIEEAALEAERFSVSVGEVWTRVPVGLYTFDVEMPIDTDGDAETELDARPVHLWVYTHDRPAFEELEAAIAKRAIKIDAEAWLDEFFAGTPTPQPSLARLELLASFVRAEKRMPTFVPLDRRDEIDPDAIARHLHERDARRAEREAAIDAAVAANSVLVDTFFGGRDGLRNQVLDRINSLEKGEPQGFEELRLPRLRSGNRTDYRWGKRAHDLDVILDAVICDPDLFPKELPRPSEGICWAKRPLSSAWAHYSWEDNDAEGLTHRIEVNPLLDAAEVPREVIEFLVYHELLHHEDILGGNRASPHDRGFRERERKHPAIVDANRFVDTLLDRMSPLDRRGRPLRE